MIRGIYLVKSNKKDLLKVGMTNNFDVRIKNINSSSLNLGNDEEFEYVRKIECIQNRELEKELHNIFSKKRVKGEWFNITLEDFDRVIENITLENYNIEKREMSYKQNMIIGDFVSIDIFNFNEIDLYFGKEKTILKCIDNLGFNNNILYHNNKLYVDKKCVIFICTMLEEAILLQGYYTKKFTNEFMRRIVENRLKEYYGHSSFSYAEFDDICDCVINKLMEVL